MTFSSEADAISYVDEELARGLPTEWSFERDSGPLRWRIVRQGKPPVAGWDEYDLEVTGDLCVVIIYYGNSDAGPLRIEKVMQAALVVHCEAFEWYPLRQMLPLLLASYAPNRWGLT